MEKTNQTADKSNGSKSPLCQLSRKDSCMIKQSTANGKVHPHCYRPGMVALREICNFQKTATLLTRKLHFQHLIREIYQDRKSNLRFQEWLVEASQHISKDTKVEYFEEAHRAAIYAQCFTVMHKNIKLATHMLSGTADVLAAFGTSKRGA